MEDNAMKTNTLFLTHFLGSLMEYLKIITLLLALSVEAFLIHQQWKPIFLLCPLVCVSVFCYFTSSISHDHVFLVDFSCLKPPNNCKVPFSGFIEHVSRIESFNQESISFMEKILHSSGQCQETYLPPPLHSIPPKTRHSDSISEVHMLLFPIMEDLLTKTNISASRIDMLVVNCSGFCPAPSLSSILVNKFKMRPDVKSYNISGMGCSAGSLSIDLAKHLLRLHPNSYVVVLSTEILSTGWYPGNDKSMLLLNCHFRMGSAAILLTNNKNAKHVSKYKLFQSIRSHSASDDAAYNVVFRSEDEHGITGVALNRDSLHVAGEVIHAHVSRVGAIILPLSEKLRYVFSIIHKKIWDQNVKLYVANFKTVVQHFILPTSGKGVIREVGKGVGLGEREMEAALMTLERFGNQSSSALWYQLVYIEAKEKMNKGDKVWQLGMGSGTKCNSVIWECLRPIVGEAHKGPWADSIHMYSLVAA